MKPGPAFLLSCLVLCGCATPKYEPPPSRTRDFAHYYSKGGWGIDSDIWIYSDGTYVVTWFDSATRKIEKTHSGRSKGLFRSMVRAADRNDAWPITTKTLEEEVGKAAAARNTHVPDITDLNREYLEIRADGKILKADFYGADIIWGKFPEVKSLDAFVRIINQIREGIG